MGRFQGCDIDGAVGKRQFDGAAGGGEGAQNGSGHGGFAAAAFADDSEDLAGHDVEADVVNGLDEVCPAFEEPLAGDGYGKMFPEASDSQ